MTVSELLWWCLKVASSMLFNQLGKLLTPYILQFSFRKLGICLPQKSTNLGV